MRMEAPQGLEPLNKAHNPKNYAFGSGLICHAYLDLHPM